MIEKSLLQHNVIELSVVLSYMMCKETGVSEDSKPEAMPPGLLFLFSD